MANERDDTMAKTTAARSRNYMRRLGYTAEVVEHRIGSFMRVDLFGVADVLAYKPGEGIILIQAYRDSKSTKRRHSHMNSEYKHIKLWLQSGGRFQHHVWKKTTKHGIPRWKVEVKEITAKSAAP